jgi:hypothetical protein
MSGLQHGVERTQTCPVVSIGFPVHNGMPFVRQALDSLLGQTFTAFELIISDNASTDGTSEVCAGFAQRDSRIRYLRQPRNIGLIPNFAFVLHAARGRHFMWAASDDLWDRRYVETLSGDLDADPACVGAFSLWREIDADGAVLRDGPHLALQSLRARNRLWNLTFGRADVCTYGVWRSHVVKRLTIRPWPLVPSCSDEQSHTWLYFLAGAGPVRESHRSVFYHRRHPTPEVRLSVIAWVKVNQMLRTPPAVWRGSRSLPIAAESALLNIVYQLRNMVWLATKRVLGLESRSRAEMAAAIRGHLANAGRKWRCGS